MNLSNAARLDGADRCGRKIKDAPQDVFDHTAARTARRTARGQPLVHQLHGPLLLWWRVMVTVERTWRPSRTSRGPVACTASLEGGVSHGQPAHAHVHGTCNSPSHGAHAKKTVTYSSCVPPHAVWPDGSRTTCSTSRSPSSCIHHGSPSGGEGREPPGTHGARHRPGVSPGSGLTETATGPGSTLTARGGADSL